MSDSSITTRTYREELASHLYQISLERIDISPQNRPWFKGLWHQQTVTDVR
jgi:hypothetical protein